MRHEANVENHERFLYFFFRAPWCRNAAVSIDFFSSSDTPGRVCVRFKEGESERCKAAANGVKMERSEPLYCGLLVPAMNLS